MKMKKIILGATLGFLGVFAQAQNGLEGLIIEKYYVSNAADAAGSAGTLPDGSATWRIYADMLPGYKFQMAYGDVNHALLLQTSTTFFNNEDRGATTPTYTKTQARANTVMLDSWLSVGAGCAGNSGVLKTEDDGLNNVVNSNGLLTNTDATIGLPLTAQDGLLAVTPDVVTFVGIGATELSVLDATSQAGNTVTTTDGAWACLNGAVGPTSTNRVLIAQITTDGIFHYALNIQIGTPSGGIEKYVVSNPLADEITIPSLVGTYSPGNAKPLVSITSPANNSSSTTGEVVVITADASDADGSVVSVQFYVDGISIGTDATSPYSANYTGVSGAHNLTAIATDNVGAQTTSSAIALNVGTDPFPVVSITAPVTGAASLVGETVAIAANATDNGTISAVEFFVDGVSLSVDNSAPYTASYVGVVGNHILTARATDNKSQTTTSAAVTIVVRNNTPPSVSITNPLSGQNLIINTLVTISANASDVDGTITSVEFRANGVSLGVDNSAPYSIDWTPAAEGTVSVSAIATDNKLTSTTATVSVKVNDPNGLPYEISDVNQTCLPSSVCIPVVSTKATMANVIGYDIVMNYDSSKVMPTGNITVSNDLIDASLTGYTTYIDTANSLMNISIFFGGSAIDGTNFHGAGRLFCAEFAKTSNFTSVDTALFSISSLDESYGPAAISAQLVKSGMFTTYKDSTFHGTLSFWSDNSPIGYDVANPNDYLITNIYGCAKPAASPVQPNVNGEFVYDIWNGTSINISRDILPTTNVHSVIMAADAYYASLVSVKNTLVFTPTIYQAIAMDVNADGRISAGDVSQINQRAAQAISQFKQVWNASTSEPSKDWLFVNSTTLAGSSYKISANYPETDGIGFSKYSVPVVDFCQTVPVLDYTDCPLISSDVYKGIMLGDVDGTYASIPRDGLLKSAAASKSDDEVIIDLSKAITKNGVITVPVSVSSSLELHAIDLGIIYNGEKIEKVVADSPENNPNKLNGLNSHDSINRVDIACYNTNEAIPASKSFTLSITKKNTDVLKSSDFNGVQVNLTGAAYGSTIDASLKIVESTNSTSVINSDLVRIYPNPANDVLNVMVPENSKVEIFELNGRQVIMETSINANETQAIDLQNLATGVYFVKVSGDSFVKMQKVIVNK